MTLRDEQLDQGTVTERAAVREAQRWHQSQYQRGVAPLTGATAGAMLAAQTLALNADNPGHIQAGLARLFTIMNLHARRCIEARQATTEQ
jgi:hypothetical protein